MIRRVMIQLCRCLFGLSVLGLHAHDDEGRHQSEQTVADQDVQVLVAAWIIYIKIRAPD